MERERKRAWVKGGAGVQYFYGFSFYFLFFNFLLLILYFLLQRAGRDIFAFHAEIIKKEKKYF